MNFYYETLSRCIEHFGSDHEDAERYIHWITENAAKDAKTGKISQDDYDRFMNVITDLF